MNIISYSLNMKALSFIRTINESSNWSKICKCQEPIVAQLLLKLTLKYETS